jgi:HD-like signal output (HDOD) protein
MPTTDQSRNERYKRVIENIDQLPSLPGIVQRLIEVVTSPDSSAEDASSLIERDPALTGRMLRLANSAFYGMPRAVSSVNSAVVILGFNSIKSLVLSTAVAKLFPASKTGGGFDTRRFWMHSIICAMGARLIIRHLMRFKMMDPESAFCAGIMHDIGRMILWHIAPADCAEVSSYALGRRVALVDAEQAVLGISHDQIGRIVADKWALPLDLELAIVFHHRPQEADTIPELVAAVHVADRMAHDLGYGNMDNEVAAAPWEASFELLHIENNGYDQLVAGLQDETDKSKEFFSIIA